MAWAHVQTTEVTESGALGTIARAYGSDVGAGSLLVCTVSWYAASGETITGVADSLGQTWAQAGSTITVTSTGGNWSEAVFYFLNSAGGANTVTATFSTSTQIRSITIGEYSGIATTGALDQTTGQSQVDPGTGTDAVTSTTVTTGANNELVYGGGFVIDTVSLATGTNFTLRSETGDGVFKRQRVEDRNLATAGSVAATFTAGTATGDTAVIVVTFKEPSGAISTPNVGSDVLTGAAPSRVVGSVVTPITPRIWMPGFDMPRPVLAKLSNKKLTRVVKKVILKETVHA